MAPRMHSMLHNPAYWILKSEEALVIAENMQCIEARDMMIGIAEAYHRLAMQTEKTTPYAGRPPRVPAADGDLRSGLD